MIENVEEGLKEYKNETKATMAAFPSVFMPGEKLTIVAEKAAAHLRGMEHALRISGGERSQIIKESKEKLNL